MLKIEGLIEAAVYVKDLERAEKFYRGVLGLQPLRRNPGRHVFFRVGRSVLLVFSAETTRKDEKLPPHGAEGPGHVALGIKTEELEPWRAYLTRHQIEIEKEVTWPSGGRSLYFRDPDGNLIELITPRSWGLPSGW